MKKFDILDCNPSPTPSAHGVVLCRDDGANLVDETTYKSIAGSLTFLAHTRPNITYSVSFVSRYMKNPYEIHMKATTRILRYAKGTINFGIHYYSPENFNLVGFSDSYWGGSMNDRKSTFGNCFSFGSSLIIWRSKNKTLFPSHPQKQIMLQLPQQVHKLFGSEIFWKKLEKRKFRLQCFTVIM